MSDRLSRMLKHVEFSKRLLIFVQLLLLASYILIVISVFKGFIEPLVAFITGSFSLASIAFGFYFWKAKCENINKYGKNIDKETLEKIAHYYDLMSKDETNGR